MSILKEFKEFAVKGNAVDMAVGIIIGAAFGKIVSSLVADIIMPPIGKLMGDVDFSNLFIVLGEGKYASLAAAKEAGAATVNYGVFLNQIISFLIVAFSVFILVKAINSAKRGEKEKTEDVPEAPPREEVLLEEIRDLLKSQVREAD